MTNNDIFIVGTGNMAVDYAKVLKAQNYAFTVIGRSEVSAALFEEITSIKPRTGGIEKYLEANHFANDAYVIIATGTQDLMQTLLTVLKAGAFKVLVEKPAAISIDELLENEKNLKPFNDKIYVAYNRRFYASVIEAQKLIEEDGGLQSMHFEFTEWAHKIEPLQKAAGVKENWFFANSTHVVDLAFFIAGQPVDWRTYNKPGNITWTPHTIFTGAGITDKGVLFSYTANWESAGRWGIELMTRNRRIYLKPLETLKIQWKGTVEILDHEFIDLLDKRFKAGIYKQVESFLGDCGARLLKIDDFIFNSKNIYQKMIS